MARLTTNQAKLERNGQEFIKPNTQEKFKIIDYIDSRNVTIQFEDGTILYNIHWGNIIKFKVNNPNYNKESIKISDEKAHIAWRNLKKRTLIENNNLLSYNNCFLHKDWLIYDNFKNWFNQNYIDGFQLDKDLLQLNKIEKIYGPNTCCFLPSKLNNLIKINQSEIKGIILEKNNYYYVRCGKKYLGSFVDKYMAQKSYVKEKLNQIKLTTEKYKNQLNNEIYNFILNIDFQEYYNYHFNKLTNGKENN